MKKSSKEPKRRYISVQLYLLISHILTEENGPATNLCLVFFEIFPIKYTVFRVQVDTQLADY